MMDKRLVKNNFYYNSILLLIFIEMIFFIGYFSVFENCWSKDYVLLVMNNSQNKLLTDEGGYNLFYKLFFNLEKVTFFVRLKKHE